MMQASFAQAPIPLISISWSFPDENSHLSIAIITQAFEFRVHTRSNEIQLFVFNSNLWRNSASRILRQSLLAGLLNPRVCFRYSLKGVPRSVTNSRSMGAIFGQAQSVVLRARIETTARNGN